MGQGTNKKTGEKYPPTIKATVVISGRDPVELFEKISDNPTVYNCLIPGDVKFGCGMTAIVHVPWIYRKSGKRGGWDFSIRMTLIQAQIFPATGSVLDMPRKGCAIVDS